MVQMTEEEAGEFPLSLLPPLLPPKYAKFQESLCGVGVVLVTTSAMVGTTHGMIGSPENRAEIIMLILIYTEAALALLFLAGMLWGDPGVVKRNAKNCYPVPPTVKERLLTGETSMNGVNGGRHIEGEDGMTYCLRCFVWRPKGKEVRFAGSSSTHHCSTCNRCVVKFDHHCGVFGRCIAGDACGWFQPGNYNYFVSIIGMCFIGCCTTIASMVVSRVGFPDDLAAAASIFDDGGSGVLDV
eukprot:gene17808-20774_t